MNSELAAALERLLERFLARRRSPGETPLELTRRYVKLLVAHAFARLGHVERARALAFEKDRKFESYLPEPIHTFLLGAFRARVDQACAGRPRTPALPKDLVAGFAGLDRDQRYKVNRLRAASRILAPVPIEAVTLDGPVEPPPEDLPTPEARVARARASVHADPELTIQLLGGAPEDLAMPLLLEAVDALDAMDRPPLMAYVEAVVACAAYGWAELVPRLLGPLAAQGSTLEEDALAAALSRVLPALRHLELLDDMRALFAKIEGSPFLQAGLKLTACRLLHDGARVHLGEPGAGAVLAKAADTPLHNLLRPAALGYALAPTSTAIAGIEKLANQLATLHVGHSTMTRTHFAVEVLAFVDALVDSLAEARIGRDVRSGASSPDP